MTQRIIDLAAYHRLDEWCREKVRVDVEEAGFVLTDVTRAEYDGPSLVRITRYVTDENGRLQKTPDGTDLLVETIEVRV